MPVLSNVLLSASNDEHLIITGTDLEVELVAASQVALEQTGAVTLPARKLLEIIRALPEKTTVTLATEGERVTLRAGRSRFTLSSLPAADFPLVEEIKSQQTVALDQGEFRKLIEKTQFSMAQQDVRYYLNGLLLETDGQALRGVATDGHRLALYETELNVKQKTSHQVILPRKGVLELQKILATDGTIELTIGTNHVRCQVGDIRFTSKLIDGRFPDYQRIIPAPAHKIEADREALRHALLRAAILSNEKFRGIRLTVRPDLLIIQAHNPEQEEAEEQLDIAYQGEELQIGFNVNYLLDVLSAVDGDTVEIALTDGNSACLITAPGTSQAKYVVMPIRL